MNHSTITTRNTISLIILILLLSACGSATQVTEAPATPTATVETVTPATEPPTPAPLPTLAPPTPTDEPIEIEPTATNTLVATNTPLPPTETPTATPIPVPVIRLNEGDFERINVRGGPGTNYPVVSQLNVEQIAIVTGRNEANDWWQINLDETDNFGWVFGDLVTLTGDPNQVPLVEAPPPPPTVTPAPVEATENEIESPTVEEAANELADELRCGKDFCVTFQELLPIWENGGCVGNHSIYITVLQGLPPGRPMDGVVIGDTFNNVEVASGSHGPGRTEITLWNNSMTLTAKRHIDGTPYTSEESFNFTSHDELIPPEVLAAAGYCEGRVETCRVAHQNNQVCRGHYSWRVTFHKFD